MQFLRPSSVMSAVTLTTLLVLPGSIEAQQGQPFVSEGEYERWQTELTNWGRWGPDDEMGTLNLITPAKRLQAARLVRSGTTVSLSSIADTQESVDNPCPVQWEMANASRSGASDRISYPCIHGLGTTHIDGFAHRFFGGKMWNGYDVEEFVTMGGGATKNAVLTMRHGIVTRGVLYDIPRLKGVDYLGAGDRVTVADLEAWEQEIGVQVGPGDAMLFRWGRWARKDALGSFDTWAEAAGLDNTVIPWLKERDIAILGWESPGYTPRPEGDLPTLALHDFTLAHLGVHLIDRANLDELAKLAEEQNRWEFMLTINPLPIPNGTGSPVNPVAIF